MDVVRDDQHSTKSAVRDIGEDESPHPVNKRRAELSWQLFVVSMLMTFGLGVGLVLWIKSLEEKRSALGQGVSGQPVAAMSGTDAERLAKLDEQIVALQQQVDTWRREQLLNQKEVRESLERVAGNLKNAQAPNFVPVRQEGGQPGVGQTAEVVLQISPTQKEFIQLKERNRLTAYADEVIATGMRKPLETLVSYLRDPESAHLYDAVQAEYLRAVRAIQTLQREDPGYRLPVAEMFKDEGFRNEADLKAATLFKLLEDVKQPVEVRVRVAALLRGVDAAETNAKLIKAIQEDPSLEVAKHAQIALEQRISRRFRMLDIPAIEAWWKSQGN